MIVYVDDFILISPAKHEARIWAELDKHILFKDPSAPLERFLGVNHKISKLADGGCRMLTEGKEYLDSAIKESPAQALMIHSKKNVLVKEKWLTLCCPIL